MVKKQFPQNHDSGGLCFGSDPYFDTAKFLNVVRYDIYTAIFFVHHTPCTQGIQNNITDMQMLLYRVDPHKEAGCFSTVENLVHERGSFFGSQCRKGVGEGVCLFERLQSAEGIGFKTRADHSCMKTSEVKPQPQGPYAQKMS